jgi:ribonuclease HII
MKRSIKAPTLDFERTLWKKGYCVIGIDEVGRGALAGPVYVGAVCLNSVEFLKVGIRDSKELSAQKREELAKIIRKIARSHVVSFSSASVINRIGIVKATERAIRSAITKLIEINGNSLKYFVLLDAFYVKHMRGIGLKNQLAIIKGDQKSISIAAASIIAKVERDRVMTKLAKRYRDYEWDVNKGYGTVRHRNAITKHGVTKYHRKLFVRKLHPLSQDKKL